ncbi:MAG: hypothetical protein AAFP82_00020 [Bacteroidota bacterium]
MKKQFLVEDISSLLKELKVDTEPAFGLMTSQHMVEHLIWIFKTSVKDHGQPTGEPTKGQLWFKKFIANGAVLKHYPSDKTKADLPSLKYESLERALVELPVAVKRFYDYFEANPTLIAYHPRMGSLSFEELELFHYMHCRYHCWQFGLLETYP